MENASEMQQLMDKLKSGVIPDLAAAYVAAWAEVGVAVKKDANNPHFGSDYATLEAHLNAIKPVFARHGLAVLQSPGAIVEDKLSMVTLLIHKSGQSVRIDTHIPLGGKSTAQTMGSAATYGARYVLRGVGGLAASDDDGNAASQQPEPAKQRTTKPKSGGAKEESYAEGADKLITDIEAFTGNYDELEKTLRPRVEQLADAKVNDIYVAKRRALRGKK